MAKARAKKPAARAEAIRLEGERRELKMRLRRLVKDQKELAALTKQLRAAEARTGEALESLRDWLINRSADSFVTEPEQRDAGAGASARG